MYDKKIFEETFSNLKASEDTLTEVLKMTTKKKRPYKILRIIPIAAAFIFLFSVTALAVAGFTLYENPAAMLRAFFGENGTVKSDGIVEYDEFGKLDVNLPGWERVPVDETLADELIAPYISGETASASWEGYTLTVEANLHDPIIGAGLLYYTVENPDGISGYEVFYNGEFGWVTGAGNIYTNIERVAEKSYIDEAKSTETKLYICSYYVEYQNTEMQISVGVQEQVSVPICEGGPMGLVLKEHENVTIKHANGGEIPSLSLADGKVVVSPIGIRTYNEELGFDTASQIQYIALRYEDGSEYVLIDGGSFVDNSMYALGSGLTERYFSVRLFNRIVDINSLSEIVLEDVVIKVR